MHLHHQLLGSRNGRKSILLRTCELKVVPRKPASVILGLGGPKITLQEIYSRHIRQRCLFFVLHSVVILTLSEKWTNTHWQLQENNMLEFVCSSLMAVYCCKRSALASVSWFVLLQEWNSLKIHTHCILLVLFLKIFYPLLDDALSVCQYQNAFNCCEMLWVPQERRVTADEFSLISDWISSGRWGTFFFP